MGVKRLKIKDDLHYKRGPTWANCGQCDHLVRHFDVVVSDGHGARVTTEPRCKIIGLKPGRQYRIHPANICDRYDNTEGLKKYKAMMG
jgi:hypothetical protein